MLGTVICTSDGPSVSQFQFVISPTDSKLTVKLGEYVELDSQMGKLIGVIQEIVKTNRYFSHPSAVQEYERSGRRISSIFPADRWEYAIATVRPLGVMTINGFQRLRIPPSPGAKIHLANSNLLNQVLGFNHERGLLLGALKVNNIEAKIDMNRLLQKHLAILAMSGAGKSYTTAVLLEELLNRKTQDGRVVTVVFDVHGEYTGFADSKVYQDKCQIISGSLIQVPTPDLSALQLQQYSGDMSLVQVRELNRVITKLRKKMKTFDLNDLIKAIRLEHQMKVNTKEALQGWLYRLVSLNTFTTSPYPDWKNTLQPGQLIIIDLHDIISLRKKQILVSYVLSKIFELRRSTLIPPSVIVLEESHQFCSEQRHDLSISKSIIELIAREGRKWNMVLTLISQRPVKLSTTALSQCSTNIIMKITNPYDLQHIGQSSEGIDKITLEQITTLDVGDALIVGSATNFPVFMHVRQLEESKLQFSKSLEKEAIGYEKKSARNNQ